MVHFNTKPSLVRRIDVAVQVKFRNVFMYLLIYCLELFIISTYLQGCGNCILGTDSRSGVGSGVGHF